MVSTPLKNISQLGLLFPMYGKIKNVPNQQPVLQFSYNRHNHDDHQSPLWSFWLQEGGRIESGDDLLGIS